MKKNIFFIISSGIIILLSMYNILFAHDLVNNTIDSLKELTSNMDTNYFQQVINIYQNSGEKLIITNAIISIIASLLFILLSIKDELFRFKSILIFLSVLLIIFATNNIISIIAAINLILVINIKNEKASKKNVNKKIPIIKYEKATLKKKIAGALLMLFYLSQIIWAGFVPNDYISYWTIVISFDLIVFIFAIALFYEELVKGFRYFKNNVLVYIKYLLAKYGIGLLLFVFTNIIVMIVTNQETSVNQSILETLPLWYIIPSTIIWAPIVEEILFRGVLRRFISNNIIFIIVSALFFGFLHAMQEATIFNVIAMTMPYAVLGGMLAYVYAKTNNILGNIFIHALHNTIAVIILITTM